MGGKTRRLTDGHSLRPNLEMAGEVDLNSEQIEEMLVAIAPIVGSARVASAAGKMVRALGLEISLAELDEA